MQLAFLDKLAYGNVYTVYGSIDHRPLKQAKDLMAKVFAEGMDGAKEVAKNRWAEDGHNDITVVEIVVGYNDIGISYIKGE